MGCRVGEFTIVVTSEATVRLEVSDKWADLVKARQYQEEGNFDAQVQAIKEVAWQQR